MKMILFLLRASWQTAVLSGIVGGLSGVASVGLVAMILRTVQDPTASSAVAIGQFAGLCVVVLTTRIVSQVLVSRLTQSSVHRLQMGLCQRVLDSPINHLEEVGVPRILATLGGDVSVVSQAMSGVPPLVINFVILLAGAVYLGSLSPALLCARRTVHVGGSGQLPGTRRLLPPVMSSGPGMSRMSCNSESRN